MNDPMTKIEDNIEINKDSSEIDADETVVSSNDIEGPDDPLVENASQADEVSDLKDQLLRALAEVENTRRRAKREKEDMAKYAITNFARDVLAVSDNLTRALETVPEENRAGDKVIETLFEGVELTQRLLNTSMEKHGITKIEPLGDKFDHNFHQAMYEVESADVDPGTIVNVAQAGYLIGERLLRPAMVGVAKRTESPKGTDKDTESTSDKNEGSIGTKSSDNT